LAITLGMVAQW